MTFWTISMYRITFCYESPERIRVDGKVQKVYDVAQTPYQRVLASPDVSEEGKPKLRELYPTLNPEKLLESIETQLRKL